MYWNEDFTHQFFSSPEEAHIYSGLKRAHGILMVLAFLTFMTTGIYFARYFRSHWPNTKPMGLLLWFHFHRTINMIAIAASIAGFVCIFANKGWFWFGPSPVKTDEFNRQWGAIHCILGLLACVLAWAQPLNAVFRCLPTSRFRIIFNLLHWFSGYSAWLMGLAAIVIAIKNFVNLSISPPASLGLIIAYLVTLGVIIIVNELMLVYEWNQRRRIVVEPGDVEIYKGQSVITRPAATIRRIQIIRIVIFLFYLIIVALGLPIAICVLIGLVPDNQVNI